MPLAASMSLSYEPPPLSRPPSHAPPGAVATPRDAVVAPRGAMRARFLRSIASVGLPARPGPRAIVTNADLAALPTPVQRYMRFMGVVGRPQTWSMRVGWYGRFRMKPSGPWLPCEAWQYNRSLPIARIFRMRLRFGGVLPVTVHDDYLRGGGHMEGKLLGVFHVADERVEEISVGELITYVNDAVLLAPSMLLGPDTAWTAQGGDAFDVTVTDGGRAVTAHVSLDARGAPMDFSTMDRFYQPPDEPLHRWVRTRWTTPVAGFQEMDGHPVPTRGAAVWHTPEGPFPYADFRILPGSFALDVAPGA